MTLLSFDLLLVSLSKFYSSSSFLWLDMSISFSKQSPDARRGILTLKPFVPAAEAQGRPEGHGQRLRLSSRKGSGAATPRMVRREEDLRCRRCGESGRRRSSSRRGVERWTFHESRNKNPEKNFLDVGVTSSRSIL